MEDKKVKAPFNTDRMLQGNNNDSEPKLSNIDDITSSVIGIFGKWQFGISVMMALLKLPIVWAQLGIVFLAPEQKFWCQKPKQLQNMSLERWLDVSKPDGLEDNGCKTNYSPRNFSSSQGLNKIVNCDHFSYNDSDFSSTIISEWDLVCSRGHYVELSQMILMLGVLIGSILFGVLSDKYGRKKPMQIAILLQAITFFSSALMPSLFAFLTSRFVLGIASGGIATISFVMCLEVVGGKWRTIIPILYQIPYGLGTTIMAGVSYNLRDWRKFQIALSLLSLFYLIYIWLLSESPRWLLATNNKEEVIEMLEKIAVVNGRDPTIVREIINKDGKKNGHEKRQYSDKFYQSRNLKIRSTILCLQWFLSGIGFYGFLQNIGKIGSNVFLTVAMGGVVSAPGALLCIIIVQKFGRKSSMAFFQLLTAASFFLIPYVPRDVYPGEWPRVLLCSFGVIGLSVYIPALFLFTGELLPTVIRNAGIGIFAMVNRLGSVVAPFVLSLDKVYPPLPMLILASVTLLQAILLYPLPETKGCPLPDTIQQAEAFDKNAALQIRKSEKYNKYNIVATQK